jgi:integrase
VRIIKRLSDTTDLWQFSRTAIVGEESDCGATLLICLALLRGAKPKVISEALGHSSVAFTMDTYSHIISGMQEDMMALLDEAIPSDTRRQSQASNIGSPS